MVGKKELDADAGVTFAPPVAACPFDVSKPWCLTTGAACEPDDSGGLGDPADWPADLLALVREGLSLSPVGLPIASRALAAAVAERFAAGRGDDPAPLVVRIEKAQMGACSPEEIERILAFTRRVHELPTAHRPVFSFVLRECAAMLVYHREHHAPSAGRAIAACPFCTGLLPVEPAAVPDAVPDQRQWLDHYLEHRTVHDNACPFCTGVLPASHRPEEAKPGALERWASEDAEWRAIADEMRAAGKSPSAADVTRELTARMWKRGVRPMLYPEDFIAAEEDPS